MGSRSSTSRRMNRETGEDGEGDGRREDEASGSGGAAGGESGNRDLATILSYLIRSGQVRILSSGGLLDEDDDFFDDEDEFMAPATTPKGDTNPDISKITGSEFAEEIREQSGQGRVTQHSISHLMRMREIGQVGQGSFNPSHRRVLSCNYLPNHVEPVARYNQKAFCGTYALDGRIFLSASQDQRIRIYDTTRGQFRLFKTVRARDVGWSILDTAFSPDGNYLIYSSWSQAVHICNIYGEEETHNALYMFPQGEYSFCIFSLTFSMDNQEIMGGANDGCLYVYDRERNERTLRIDAHDDDVNAVSFADMTSQILYSGGDDGLVKVWDRRTLRESSPKPVGILAGHMDGITFIETKGDARFLISNCKDQTIKLWDIRRFADESGQAETKNEVAKQNWDYRWQPVPKRVVKTKKRLAGDTSLMTYRGHSVLHTLVRARFSPMHTTGQRYIYAGCATGAVVVYDVLTGKIVKKLKGHRNCVRDVSWHPYEHNIISTSWDGMVGRWRYKSDQEAEDERMDTSDSSSNNDSDDDQPQLRRSQRLRNRRRNQSGSGLFSVDIGQRTIVLD